MQEFIKKIIKNLESNGFPEKRVSLPVEKMYEAADNRGLSFNKVLETMKEERLVDAEIGPEKIVFSRPEEPAQADLDQTPMEDMDQAEMFKKAQEMMSNMDPAELKKMQEMVMGMSEEEKEELMKKGKDMGIL